MIAQKGALITGGSGLVGGHLTRILQANGYQVAHLSTRANYKAPEGVNYFLWDPDKEYIDPDAFNGIAVIFHLAGATVSKRWTPSYKQEILNSRTRSTQTLSKALRDYNHQVEAVISASAVGIYPSNKTLTYREDDEKAHDFLGSVSQHWEKAVEKLGVETGLRTAMLRIGIVLSRQGGVLQQMEPIFRLGLGAPLGCGKQWMSWIHADDLARQFLHVYEHSLSGVYNAGGPQPVINKDFSKQLARAMRRPFLFPWRGVPGTLLKIALGEMATLALMSQKVSDEKIVETGFSYQYPTLGSALEQLYRS